MFANNTKVKNAFKRTKQDISSLRQSTNEWTIYLQKNQLEFQQRLNDVEKRLKNLENALIESIKR